MTDTPEKELTETEMEKMLAELRKSLDEAEKERDHNYLDRDPVAMCYCMELPDLPVRKDNQKQNKAQVPPSFKKSKQQKQESHD